MDKYVAKLELEKVKDFVRNLPADLYSDFLSFVLRNYEERLNKELLKPKGRRYVAKIVVELVKE